MMNKKLYLLIFLALVLTLSGCSVLGQKPNNDPLSGSGTIEADTIHLAAEIGGKIVEIKADQGASVQAGQEIFRLDDANLLAQRNQASAALQAAQAGLESAQANLDLIKAGATDQQIQSAQAQLDQAEANRQAVQASLWNQTSGTRPEDLLAAQSHLDLARQDYYSTTVVLYPYQMDSVQAVMTQAQSNLSQAKARQTSLSNGGRTAPNAAGAAAATILDDQAAVDKATQAYQSVQDPAAAFYTQIYAVRDVWEMAQLNLSRAKARQTELNAGANVIQPVLDAARQAVTDGQALVDKANTAYQDLNSSDQGTRLSSAWIEVQSAQAALDQLGSGASGSPNVEAMLKMLNEAAAQRSAASANLASLKSGARPEQVAAAQAQVEAAKAQVAAAQAALDLVDVQIAKTTIVAPFAAVVLDRPLNVGEMANAGATVVTLGRLDQVTLTVYIPEDLYGQLKLGQKATIHVDSFPGKSFEGVVETISDQAEFTPRNVQTVETRSTTVYAVKISIPNPDHLLKPGMPADASF